MKCVITVSLLFLIGCGGAPESKSMNASVNSGDAGQDYDTNGDGQADSWRFFRGVDGKQVLARKEFDINFDGRVDIWRMYDIKGDLTQDKMDMDFGEKLD